MFNRALAVLSFVALFHTLSAERDPDELALLKEPGLGFEYYNDSCCEQAPPVPCRPCCCPHRFNDDGQFGRECGLRGIWFPEAPVLFKPLVADPREPFYSIEWRSYEKALKQDNIIAVSFADLFPVYRWFNVWPFKGGELQIDVQGAMWAIFATFEEECPLINTDYFVGVPITYSSGCWSFRLRGYHISCHLGDEFLLLNPYIDRKNPSAESIDFITSYDYGNSFRFYGGLGGSVHEDESFKCGRFFGQFGLEWRPHLFKRCSTRNRLYAVPLFAVNVSVYDQRYRDVNTTCILGYEIGKLSGWQHRVRAFLEYHSGSCFEGQFCLHKTNYIAFKMSYGY